jgi:hypothetical protein
MTSFIKIIMINKLIHLCKGFRPRFYKKLLNIKTVSFCGRGLVGYPSPLGRGASKKLKYLFYFYENKTFNKPLTNL